MKQLRESDLGRNGVFLRRVAEELALRRTDAAEVARLHHEIADDTMEKHAVVSMSLHQSEDIVTVLRRLVVERDAHIAAVGLQENLVARLGSLGRHAQGDRQQQAKQEGCLSSHLIIYY